MNKLNIFFIVFVTLASLKLCAEVDISWESPQNYRDIKAANSHQATFEERVFISLEKYLSELSEKLPEGQRLWLKVTDLDLAGRIQPATRLGLNTPRDLRIIERVDFPRISFKYHVTDSDGKVLMSGKEDIKDSNFLDKIDTVRKSRDPLGHEKRILKDWFVKVFPQQVATR